ncbi:hypothetical protein ISX50_08160 [Vibrio cyclitrophicus]|nr:hypothetical protein [Vibrio cyclitrophicus]UPR33123.1 hypothetical protein ISX50_08160 [Vibrio cyclitrophicus]
MYINLLKKTLTKFPYPIGNLVAKVPFNLRPGLGNSYQLRMDEQFFFMQASRDEQKEFVFSKFKPIVNFAFENVKFYREYYTECGFNPEVLKDYSDINSVPVINKSILQSVKLNDRSSNYVNKNLVNTGGSSGKPLELFVQPSCIPHEWAHVHKAWQSINFQPKMLKIMFVGRSQVNNVVDYDSARHSLVVDTYAGWANVADRLFTIFDYYQPQFIHGYPSAIYDFIFWLESANHPLLSLLRNKIVGIILSSEFPNSIHRDRVDNLLDCKSLSFYGHTERCIFASEDASEHYKFIPYHTYGFVETLKIDGKESLLGTSYYNYASPMIRYDTEDLVTGNYHKGLLTDFHVENGRSGDYILDKNNDKVFLTALIFGRHHKLFDFSNHVQVKQVSPGLCQVFVVPRCPGLTPELASSYFDSSNVHVCFDFILLENPIKTKVGKVPLLIK